MSAKKDLPPKDPKAIGYWVADPIPKKFLQQPKFCLHFQEHLQSLFRIELVIMLQQPEREDGSWWNKPPPGYMIQLLAGEKNKEMGQAVSDFCRNYFNSIQSETFYDSQVNKWLLYKSTKNNYLRCIQNILQDKFQDIFTVCIKERGALKVHYLVKDPFSVFNSKDINMIIKDLSEELLSLPTGREQSLQLRKELKRTIAKVANDNQVYIHSGFTRTGVIITQTKLVLFGNKEIVQNIKSDLIHIINKYRVMTYKFDSIDPSQIKFILESCSHQLQQIEKKYKKFGVDLRLRAHEFASPQYLKDEIESFVTQLLLHSSVKTIKSVQLSREVAEQAQKHLQYIARQNRCDIKIELTYKSRCYKVPKAQTLSTYLSKSVIDQSNNFNSSPYVFNKLNIANGSIEIRTGDITKYDVDTIVISNTPDGLKEGVIEQAGMFIYEHTFPDSNGMKFTETNGGALQCKRILFSNWTSSMSSENDNELKTSIEGFVSKSIEYAIKDENSSSIAFAVSDSCPYETILVQEMISSAKRQLESTNLQLRILFILFTDQHTLRNEFFSALSIMQDVYAQFEWPTAVVKATLTGSNDADIDKCQEKSYKCLKRSVDLLKLTNSHGIFQNWDQYTINSFYKYCQDKCVLPQINQTKDEIDLIGPINCVRDVQQKLNFLSQLVKERASRIAATQRPSSAVSRSARTDITSTTGHAKVYNIMISYSERDVKYCQRLIDRLAEEGFSIWAEPALLDRQRDVALQMNKSDCIILCVSENYYENQSCEKEARYAFQIGKYVFPVKIQNDPLICWQREVFKDKLFFQLFGSENHFDLGYGNLLLRILQYTQPGFVSLLQQRTVRLQQDNDESYGLMTVERRQTVYDNKIRSLMNGGRVEQEEMKHLTEQLHTILNAARNDYIEAIDINKRDDDDALSKVENAIEKEFGWIQRWLRKSTNVTKNNLPPFAPSGDINDAPFPMPDYIAKSLNLYDSSVSSKKPPIKLRHAFECDIFKRPTEQPFTRILFNIIPANKERTYGKCTQQLVPFSTSLQTSISDVFDNDIIPQKAATLPVIPLEYISSNTVGTQKYRKTTNLNDAPKIPMKIGKKRIGKKHPRPTRELLNVYLQSFAKRMNENALEFEKFCLINA